MQFEQLVPLAIGPNQWIQHCLSYRHIVQGFLFEQLQRLFHPQPDHMVFHTKKERFQICMFLCGGFAVEMDRQAETGLFGRRCRSKLGR